MSEKISIPYKFSKHEHTIIGSYFSTHTDWEKSIFDDIKENLKEHLRVQQDNKCCYCKRELGFDIKEVDIEHITQLSHIENHKFPI